MASLRNASRVMRGLDGKLVGLRPCRRKARRVRPWEPWPDSGVHHDRLGLLSRFVFT
jgi:hypothetical protein